jgi:hypothetical protein
MRDPWSEAGRVRTWLAAARRSAVAVGVVVLSLTAVVSGAAAVADRGSTARPLRGTVFIGRVTPVVPKRSHYAGSEPGPLSFHISRSGESIVDAQSVYMNGNACGGAAYYAGPGGAYPNSAEIRPDGSFSAAHEGMHISGQFQRGRSAVGSFKFHFPGQNGAVPCTGDWTFTAHVAPPVPHGKAVSPARGVQLSGPTYQGYHLSLTVSSTGHAVTGRVSGVATCSERVGYESSDGGSGPLTFQATVARGHFSETTSRGSIAGTFVGHEVVGGSVRFSANGCTGNSVPFVARHG